MQPDRLHEKIREILWADWDPIGVQDAPQARGEYDQYVSSITKMVIAGCPASDLAERLLEIEVNSMGLPGNAVRARAVAEKLLRL